MKPDFYYYGTNLTSYGHYFWHVTDTGLKSVNIRFQDIPFNPEELPRHPKGSGHYYQDGHCAFYTENGYSIFAITGSCKDHRQNSKTVFFTKGNFTFQQVWEALCDYQVFKDMIGQMKFRVQTELVP